MWRLRPPPAPLQTSMLKLGFVRAKRSLSFDRLHKHNARLSYCGAASPSRVSTNWLPGSTSPPTSLSNRASHLKQKHQEKLVFFSFAKLSCKRKQDIEMPSTPVPVPGKRRRVGMPKVRTGCLTCNSLFCREIE